MFRKTLLAVLVSMPLNAAHGYDIKNIETSHVDKRFRITLTAYLEAPVEEVYGRLTNFDELTKLSDSIEESRQLQPDEAGNVIVYTRIRPCVMFVCKTLRMFEAVTYPAEFQVLANVIAARSDFVYGRSLWVLSEQGSGTLLQYNSEFEPGFDVFPVIGPVAARYSLKKQAKKFLQGLEDAAH